MEHLVNFNFLRNLGIMKAYAEGFEIVINTKDDKWHDTVKDGVFDFEHKWYKIESAQYRPYENCEELIEDARKHNFKILYFDEVEEVLVCNDYYMLGKTRFEYGHDYFDFDTQMIWEDGSRFGVPVCKYYYKQQTLWK